MLDSLKPGQTVTCTVLATPRTMNRRQTVERLMRLDPANRKALRTAQRKRAQRINIYNRGNRDWVSRETCAKVVLVKPGAVWKMRYSLDLAKDLKAVEKYVKVAGK